MADRSRAFWSKTAATSTTPVAVKLPVNWVELKLWVDVLSLAAIGTTLTAPAVTAVNGILTLSVRGTPTSGTFALAGRDGNNVRTFTTAGIAYNASAATIKTALTNTGVFASGDITAAGGALPTDVTLTFTGSWAGVVPSIAPLNANMVGGSVQIPNNTITAASGNGGYGYIENNTQEVWSNNENDTTGGFLYIATTTGAGNYRITCYR